MRVFGGSAKGATRISSSANSGVFQTLLKKLLSHEQDSNIFFKVVLSSHEKGFCLNHTTETWIATLHVVPLAMTE